MKRLKTITLSLSIIILLINQNGLLAQVPETGGTFSGLVNFNQGVNPNFEPTNYNNQDLLNSASFNNGFSYHNASGGTAYPSNGTGSVWTFKQSNTRLHRMFFSKNNNKFYLSSWNGGNSAWNGWERILTDANYTSIFGIDVENGNLQVSSSKYIYMGSTNDRIKAESSSIGIYPNQNLYLGAVIGGQEIKHVTVFENGNVAIGTSSTGSHKLAVEGSIGAREIKVEAFPNWSDFVFEEEYELPTLVEVENHIKENGHLKDVPSAEEVKEDGIYLGQMDAKLLQKIEELTLYMIDMNKRVGQLEEENEELKKEISTLKKE